MSRENPLAGTRPELNDQILLTSAEGFDGYEIMAYMGMTWGMSVRAKDLGQDCAMGCKMLFGGELNSYAELGNESRQRAIDNMMEKARSMGANAIINVRFDMEGANEGATQVVAHGTAVQIKPIKDYVPVGAMGNILADIKDQLEPKGTAKSE